MTLDIASFALGLLVAAAAMGVALPLLGRRRMAHASRDHARELAGMTAERDRLARELSEGDGAQGEVTIGEVTIGDLTADEENLRRRIDALADELVDTAERRRLEGYGQPTPGIAGNDKPR